MSVDDKNKMFEDIKNSVDLGQTLDPLGQDTDANASSREAIERELLNRLSAEKHRLCAELEIKFKEASIKRVKAEVQKFKELIEQERKLLLVQKQKFEQALKEKYSRVMKSMLKNKEKELSEKIKNKHYATDLELRQHIEQLQKEIEQQKQNASLLINQAKIAAKHEQEQASRALYDNIMAGNREEIQKNIEEKLSAEYLQKELALKREHELNIKKHTAKLIATYEERLREALNDKEQALLKSNSEHLTRQSELFNHRIQQEVETAVAAATSKLELEHGKEKQALNAIIEGLKPELEANRLRMRVEVEKELRDEFEIKFAEYKRKIEEAKALELEALITTEKQKLAEGMQQENMVVLKYKEREIRESCTAEFERNLQVQIQKNLSEQEKRLRAEFEAEFARTCAKLNEDHALQVQAEVIQERARITDKATSEKKILLQQQQTNLEEQHANELAHKLAMQAQTLTQQHQIEIRNLESKIFELQNAQVMATPSVIEPMPKPQMIEPLIPEEPYLIPGPKSEDPAILRAEKEAALAAQEQRLRSQFAKQLQEARMAWEQERADTEEHSREEELAACEARLRREFQAILEQQRLQAAANFAKQRDVELRASIAKYKQKLLNEMEGARLNELHEIEANLKEQYAARMQQHGELARVEIERTKEQLIADQNAKIKAAVDLQMEAVQKQYDLKLAEYDQIQSEKLAQLVEEERKHLGIKFAQDKANLIKELTAKFAREKHIAMNKYETELREKLYKEMVKQKDFIQTKFTEAQEAALSEQKRRLEAQHKHEIERIKQGFFDPNGEYAKHDEIIAKRNVEQLADRILSKFQK